MQILLSSVTSSPLALMHQLSSHLYSIQIVILLSVLHGRTAIDKKELRMMLNCNKHYIHI